MIDDIRVLVSRRLLAATSAPPQLSDTGLAPLPDGDPPGAPCETEPRLHRLQTRIFDPAFLLGEEAASDIKDGGDCGPLRPSPSLSLSPSPSPSSLLVVMLWDGLC